FYNDSGLVVSNIKIWTGTTRAACGCPSRAGFHRWNAARASASFGRNVPHIKGPSGRSITAKPRNLRALGVVWAVIFGAVLPRHDKGAACNGHALDNLKVHAALAVLECNAATVISRPFFAVAVDIHFRN